MFNYDLDQEEDDLAVNNFCGGYALGAVVNSIQNMPLNQPLPLDVYNRIQQNQNRIGAYCQSLLLYTMVNGTAISLPSSIAITAQNYYGFAASVIYWVQDLMIACLKPIMQEEVVHLNRANINNSPTNNNLATILAGQSNGHFILLVREGRHWISIEKQALGFQCYDPGQHFPTGPVNINENNIIAIANSYMYTYSGVMVVIL